MSKIKFEVEVPVHASSKMLYEKLATASGLEEWFADKVILNGKLMTFIWDDSEEKAKIIKKKTDQYIKLKWTESGDDDSYFELRIVVDDITHDVSIIVTDFAEDDESLEESKQLWESQLEELKHVIGA